MTAVGFIEVPDGDTREFVLRQIEAKKLTLTCNSTKLSIVRALTNAAKDRNTDLFSAVDLLKQQPGLMDSDVAMNLENRCVNVRGQVAFKHLKRHGLVAFVAPYARLALP